MFKCPECGYLGFEEEKKCPKCGTEVTVVNSGEETNSIMNPPGGIEKKENLKEESKTALIDEPLQIEEEIRNESIKIEESPELEPPAIEPRIEVKISEPVESLQPEMKVTPEPEKKDFDFQLLQKPQQQKLPITQKRVEEQKELRFTPPIIARASAFIIDSLLVMGITSVFLLLPLVIGAGNIFSFLEFSRVFLLPFYFLFIIFHLLYYTYFLTITGQTPGKAVFNLKVVGKGGLNLDWHEALLRAIGYILSSIPVGIGFFWAFFDKNKETWHDKLTGSRVVSVNR